jgi:Neurotransmitter-gated ion-channel ligand binding domain
MKRLIAILLLLAAYAVAATQAQSAPVDMPRADGVPVRVTPILSILQLNEINDRDGIVVAEITLQVSWRDSRLAFDPIVEAREQKEFLNDAARAEVSRIWQPQIAILNQIEPPRILSSTLVIRSDGSVRLSERMQVKTRVSIELRDYPFDRQELVWQLGSLTLGREQVALVSEPLRLSRALIIKTWTIARSVQLLTEREGLTGRPFANLDVGLIVDRQSNVAVTQIFMPYMAIMFLPLICLFNVGTNTPVQLFTALLAMLTLNFKIVLENPAIASVSNAVADAMWIGYGYIGIALFLAMTIMRTSSDSQLSDFMQELRAYLKWGIPTLFIALLGGRIAYAM